MGETSLSLELDTSYRLPFSNPDDTSGICVGYSIGGIRAGDKPGDVAHGGYASAKQCFNIRPASGRDHVANMGEGWELGAGYLGKFSLGEKVDLRWKAGAFYFDGDHGSGEFSTRLAGVYGDVFVSFPLSIVTIELGFGMRVPLYGQFPGGEISFLNSWEKFKETSNVEFYFFKMGKTF